MTKKQEVYYTLLRIALPFIRSTLSNSFVYGARRRDAYEISELIHNIYLSIYEEDFTRHDIYVLNYSAKSYYEKAKGTEHYDIIVGLLSELFSLVPECKRAQLSWKGPNIVNAKKLTC